MLKKKPIWNGFPHMIYGADYNPEQWSDCPEILDEDMRMMKIAHINESTVGMFSWAVLEPEEGKYDFTFLDKIMDDVYKNGGRVILGTPSGARPAWLSRKYPEVLRTNADRTKNLHGRRHNHCYTSTVYREKVAQIDRQLALRYKDHPALLMWHLSNEYGGECHCEMCAEAFRNWLKRKYGTLDNLNKQWWTTFWAHRYTDWSQIEPPSPLGENLLHGLNIDWKRFVSYQTTDFMKVEISVLKEITPDIPITTNMMGFYKGLDYRVLAKELDAISWDSYPSWRGCNETDIDLASNTALKHDLNRTMLHKPFMLMESVPSQVSWQATNKLKRPGQNRLTSLQAVAHGSDTVQYFQWRKGRGGPEKFHGAVVDHVGNENTRVFREVTEIGEILSKLDDVVGTVTESKVAILYDWSNVWALDDMQGLQLSSKKVIETVEKWYRPLWKRGINTDVVSYDDDLSEYKLVIAPMLYMVPEKLGAKLEKYVKNGGNLVCTYTTGEVNENDLCYLGGFPGAGLKDVFDIRNEEIDVLYPNESNKVLSGNKEFKAVDYCELIYPGEKAKVIAKYASDFYEGNACVTLNEYGKGKGYYVAFRDDGTYADELIGTILEENEIKSDFDGELPYGVTAHSRTDGETTYVFLENYNTNDIEVETKKQWTDVLSGNKVTGKINLKKYETLIIKNSEQQE